MSHNILQKNLRRLIEENNYNVYELERIAGLKKNSVYNILKGLSQNPSANILQAIATSLKITVNDLFDEEIKLETLTPQKIDLLSNIVISIIREVKSNDYKITFQEMLKLISEVFHYSSSEENLEIDEKFIRWLLKQHNN